MMGRFSPPSRIASRQRLGGVFAPHWMLPKPRWGYGYWLRAWVWTSVYVPYPPGVAEVGGDIFIRVAGGFVTSN